MAPKYNSIKKIVLVLPLVFFSLAINAQEEDQPDTARILSRDMDTMVDSLEQMPPPEETVDDEYKDEPATPTVYFSDKRLQPNGGGPDSLQSRMLPDSVMKNILADDDFWYVNYPFERKEKKKEEENIPFIQTPFFQTMLWLVIIGGFLAFVIIYLSNSNAGLFRKGNKMIAAGEEGEIETDNIFEINYQREIDKAIGNGNYRLAVRLLFLRVLKNLSDKKVIQYKQDRTNFDYLLQLHSTKYYADFFRLTRNYEYSWYGQFDIEPGKFAIIKNDFESFDRNMNNR